MSIDKIQDAILKMFEKLSDTQGRFKYFRQLTLMSNDLPDEQPDGMDDSYLVPARKRKVWLKAWLENDKVFFTAYSASPIYKGLLGILLKVFSGRPPLEIINCNLYLLNEMDLYKQLNPEWREDLLAIVQRMKLLAARLKVYTLA